MTKDHKNVKKKQISVLIVEDHALTRLGLKTVLERSKLLKVVAEAVNGEEAIVFARKLKPNVILMDLRMPVIDGIEASQIISTQNSAPKIIILTQQDNDRDIAAALAAGASGYCLKDVDPERLYMAIQAVHAGDSWLDAAIADRILKTYHTVLQNTGTSTTASMERAQAAPTPGIASAKLSEREREVLKLIVDGLSNQAIAKQLCVSITTTKSHVRNILNKLAVDDRTQAAVRALRLSLIC